MSSSWRLKPRLRASRHEGRLRGLQIAPSLTSALATTGKTPGLDSDSLRRQASRPNASEAPRRGFSRQPTGAHALSPTARASTPITARADFSAIRYAQCWEDADVLL